ncbi:MAG: M1 family metallopeptidase [Rhodothermales bacterium]
MIGFPRIIRTPAILAALLATLVAASLTHATAAQTTSSEPLSDRVVSYTIDATLDAESRTVRAAERITWRNRDAVPVDELQFHLYLNAFSNNESTFMRESGGAHRGFSASGQDPWGGVRITAFTFEGADLMPAIRFIQPDDGNVADSTVISVTLPRAVAPGETIAVDLSFTSRLPEIVARTGWKTGDSGRPFFMVAQWFPKLGVYEIPGQRYVPEDAPRGAWSTHQFHANSEFYADFGTYDVTMRVPADHAVGATGLRVEDRMEDSLRVIRHVAHDVHDFAWTASPDFIEHEDRWEHVDIRLLLQPRHAAQAERHLAATKVALQYYADWIGPYPYTTLTVVDGLGGSNGMEYPTLITAGTAYGLPEWVRPLELVIIHEFGHQYFMGMLASNEAEEAWLDEGMNSYVESRIMDTEWPDGSILEVAGVRIGDRDFQRLSYTLSNPNRGPLYARSWEYPYGDFGKASYAKPATVMNTLEGYLGWERMQAFLQTYYQRWRFGHPTTRDLQETLEDVTGESFDWFFEPYVYGTAVVDYRVDAITAQSVRLERREDGVFPQRLRVTFADGTTAERTWDGASRWTTLHFPGSERIVEAHLDPDGVVWLDVNKLNNRMVTPSAADNTFARRAQLRYMAFVQRFLFLASGLL